MKIRGTFLKDYVKIIRGTRDKDWEKFLTAQDWEILDSMILPTEWYPGETMGRIADGLFELLAGESVVFVRGFGKSSAPQFFEDVTGFLVKNDIASALNKWRLIADRYIDVVSVNVEEVGENVAKVSYFPVD